MSQRQDSFDDAELTSLALEIMNDISTRATLDPKDSLIRKANISNDSSIYSIPSHYDPNTLHLSIPSTTNSITTNDNIDNNSSFIYSVENIPNLSFSSKQHKPVTLKSIWNPPPQHIPQSITIDTNENINNTNNENDINSSLFSTSLSDISTSISHIKRSQTPKKRSQTQIPDFTKCIQTKPVKIKKKKRKKKNKNLKDKNKHINNLIWQKPIPNPFNPFSPKRNKKSMTPTPKNNGKYRRYKKQKHKYKNKMKRKTRSVATPPPSNQYHQFLIELDGFDIFDSNI